MGSLNSTRWIFRAVVIASVLSGVSDRAGAALLFSNIQQQPIASNNFSQTDPSTNFRVASDFTTAGFATTITSSFVTLFNSASSPYHFTASIFTDNAGQPGTTLGSFTQMTAGGNILSHVNYSGTSPGISLAANTNYWMVLKMDEPFAQFPGGTAGWSRTTSQSTDAGSSFAIIAGTQIKSSTNSGSTWGNSQVGNQMFRLDGVPEPTTALLAAAGIFLTAGRRRRVVRS
jgi:hypothetical protein